MSRRFGVAEGVLAGMAASRGDAVIYMDADLQDPPEVIPALLGKWRRGADVVHTVRTRRHGEHPLKMLATRWAYRVIQLGSAIELPVDAGDFKLLSRAGGRPTCFRFASRIPICAGWSCGSGSRRSSCRTSATRGTRAARTFRFSAGTRGRRSASA